MLEAYGNIWDIAEEGGWDALCITTNGFVRKDGAAVMGRGIALEARNRYPGLDKELGTAILKRGNNAHVFFPDPRFDIVSLPVKHAYTKDGQPGWKGKADINLIMSSLDELIYYTNRYQWFDVLLPRPGCGNGGLSWDFVKSKIEHMLDNRFTVVTFHP